MKISNLEKILKEYKVDYGDIDISFGKLNNNGDSDCECDVEIEMDSLYPVLNITVL